MVKLKIALLALVALIAVIVIAQNTAQVEVRLLFIKQEMSVAALSVLTLLLGFAMGTLSATWMMRSPAKPKSDSGNTRRASDAAQKA